MGKKAISTKSPPGGKGQWGLLGKGLHLVALALLFLLAASVPASASTASRVEPQGAVLESAPLYLEIELAPAAAAGPPTPVEVRSRGRLLESFELEPGEHRLRVAEHGLEGGGQELQVAVGDQLHRVSIRVIPAWLSILPPLIAILLALVFREVLVSLFLGVFAGALILANWNPFVAFARSIDGFVVPALADADHAAILVFSALLGGMVGVISRSGGTQGIVERLKGYASTARRGQVATWILGVLIFFDDYANTLIVGSTMRHITDRLRISREKLAYIVDSTAAPVASLVPISTWIGFEIGLIAAAFDQLELPFNPYGTLVASIAFRFYPIFALVLGFTIAFTCRDFGPMLRAELRASHSGKLVGDGDVPLADYDAERLNPPEGTPLRALNALLPIATVVLVTLGGLYVSGSGRADRAEFASAWEWLREVFTQANSFHALLWASLAGLTVALLLAVGQRILTVGQSVAAAVDGFKSMLLAFVVLILAWAIGAVCGDLHTADFVVGLTTGVVPPHWIPALVFLASAAISFATGASWGTMAILMPLVIPVCHGLSIAAGHSVESPEYYLYLVGTISSVLAGSVWGDHCSPISDTTILSSMASGCDHIAHVRTQIPYALGIGVLGLALGDIPTALGLPPWVSLLAGSAIIIVGVRWLGTRSDYR